MFTHKIVPEKEMRPRRVVAARKNADTPTEGVLERGDCSSSTQH